MSIIYKTNGADSWGWADARAETFRATMPGVDMRIVELDATGDALIRGLDFVAKKHSRMLQDMLDLTSALKALAPAVVDAFERAGLDVTGEHAKREYAPCGCDACAAGVTTLVKSIDEVGEKRSLISRYLDAIKATAAIVLPDAKQPEAAS